MGDIQGFSENFTSPEYLGNTWVRYSSWTAWFQSIPTQSDWELKRLSPISVEREIGEL